MSLTSLLDAAAQRFGERPAYVSGDWSLTYADLRRVVASVAAGLARQGVGEGSVVALDLPTCPEYVVCYLAAERLGAVTAGLNPRLTAVERAAMRAALRPDLVVTVEEAEAGDVPEVRLAPSADGRDPLAPLRLDGAEAPAVAADPGRPVAVVFTSGTTGTPRGATFAWRQLDAVRRVDVGDTWGAGGRTLYATSLTHLGFMTKIAGSLQAGGTAYLVPRWSAALALAMTESLGLSTISGVPTQLALILDSPLVETSDLSSVRTVVVGGGPVTPSLVRRARSRLGVPVLTRYSCTEAGIGCGTGPGDPDEDAELTVGRPLPGVEVDVRGGEVLLRSAAVMTGYWRDPVATSATMTPDGYVRTGDLGEIDDRGRLRLVGRIAERYVRGGYNVSPVEVEAVLSAHPGVAAVAIAPRADDVMGEVGVACVVPRAEAPTLESLREFAGTSLAAYKLPEDLLVLDALPLTAGDKVDRRALRRRVARSPHD